MDVTVGTKVQSALKNVMTTSLGSTVKSNVTKTVMAVIKRRVHVILGVNLVGKECLVKKNACLGFMEKTAIPLVENVLIEHHVTIFLEFVIKDVSLDSRD